MIEVEIFPRYMAHQLRAQLNASIVGKLIETNKKKASLMIETDPEAKLSVEVILNDAEELNSFTIGKYYEVRGTCRNGKEMELRGFTCFGTDFDIASYNQMLQLATKEFKSIFYP